MSTSDRRSPEDVESDLLFGYLAVRDGHVDPDRHASAYRAWVADGTGPLLDLLRDIGGLDAAGRAEVERGVARWKEARDPEAGVEPPAAGRTLGATLFGPGVPIRRPAGVDSTPSESRPLVAETMVMPIPSGRGGGEVVPGTVPRSGSRYTLSHVHGEGSLGRVWLAHDHDLNRDVALKEIRPGVAGSREKVCRFLLEAEVTGQLEHPNIVPVYELARRPEDGQPFYTMRFIRGRTLGQEIAEYHRGRREGTSGRLEFARLLGRFHGVCYAVGYAHSRGVIHRDLKPENVVLGDFAEVNVVDWGLAKLVVTDRDCERSSIRLGREAASGDEGPGRIMGTPAYMAPEQAEGRDDRLDARTDIYGLGSILFEILTGRPPHQGSDVREVLGAVIEGPTPLARAAEPSVHPALEAICARAMAKDPDRRYQEAAEVALELQRFMNDEPVGAYAEPPLARLARWARRHRAWTQAGAAALVLVSIVSTVAAVLVTGARRAEAEARRQSEERFQRSWGFADNLLSDVDDKQTGGLGTEGVQRKILEKVAEAFRGFANERSDDPRLRLKSGQAQLRLAEVRFLLHDLDGAERACVDADAVFREMARAAPGDHEPIRWRAEALALRGRVLNDAARNAKALGPYRQAMAIFDRLVEGRPHDPVLLDRRASCAVGLALVLQDLRQLDEARRTYLAAIRDYDHLIEDAKTVGTSAGPRSLPADLSYRINRSRGLVNLATLLDEQGQKDEAEEACRRAIDDLEALVKIKPDVPEHLHALAASRNNLGLLLRDRDLDKDALEAFDQAVARYETLVYKKAIPRHMNGLVKARTNLATLLAVADGPSAEEMLTSAIHDATILGDLHPGDPEYLGSLGDGCHALGKIQRDRNEGEAALKSLNQAVQVRGALHKSPLRPADSAGKLRASLMVRCLTLLDLGRRKPALDDLERFLSLAPDDPGDLYNAACCWSRASALAEGEERSRCGERALGLLRRAMPPDRASGGPLADALEHDHDLDPIRQLPGFRALREPARP